MRYGSVCSGVEAATVAWRPLGWECAFVSETDAFASAVLKARLPEVPNLGDFTKITEGCYDGEIDLGSPTREVGSPSSLRGWLNGRIAAGWCGRTSRPCLPSTAGATSPPFSRSSRDGTCPSPPADGGTRGSPPTRPDASASRGECWTLDIPEFPRVPSFPGAVPQRRRRVVLVGFRGNWESSAEALLGGELCGGSAPPRRKARIRDALRAGEDAAPDCFPIDMMNLERRRAGITLRAGHVNAVCTPTQLRRLMPGESETLMGLPPGWTDVPWKGKAHAPDGFRHRACGNSMCVNVMRWVGERIAAVEAGKEFGDYGSVKDRADNGEPSPVAQEGGG